MNIKLIFKSLVILAVLALLVVMGMNNRDVVTLSMTPLLQPQRGPAALMYFAFFALGFLAGAILMTGGGGKRSAGGGGGKSGKG
jgi:hypothetical protein